MPDSNPQTNGFACAVPTAAKSDRIRLGHGSGGRLTSDLIEQTFLTRLGSSFTGDRDDAALVTVGRERLAITTDSYVVKPYRFPGGDIASLAVHGTINDLAVRGARPVCLSAAFIIEEGFPLQELESLVDSMRSACEQANVGLIAADTKVVNKGACDGIYITTTGIGQIESDWCPGASEAKPGDAILVSGELGLHGMAVMCAREDLQLEHTLLSDSAPLYQITSRLLQQCKNSLHCMRDITRGGLISVLCEIAESSGIGVEIDELRIPINPQVRAACELLGLDPLYVACEGRLVTFVHQDMAEHALNSIKQHPLGEGAAIIGRAVHEHGKRVILKSRIGGSRIVDKLPGDQLPRIC